ncbi:hypothetical protein IAU59_003246 [Kwoniella sp. CBS 9459]
MRLIKRRSSASLSSQQHQSNKSNASLASVSVSVSDPSQYIPPVPAIDPNVISDASTHSRHMIIPEDKTSRRKRNSGEMKYPPTSFGQASGSGSASSSGWTFGRMRSFKGKSRTSAPRDNDYGDVAPKTTVISNDTSISSVSGVKGESKGKSTSRERSSSGAEQPPKSTTSHPRSAPPTPSRPAIPTDPVMRSPPPSSPSGRPYFAAHPDYASSQHVPPHDDQHPPAPIIDNNITPYVVPSPPHAQNVSEQQRSGMSPPRPTLTTALSSGSSAPSSGSEGSTAPLAPVGSDGQSQRGPGRPSTSSPKKLVKRRPVTAIFDHLELVEQPSISHQRSREKGHTRSASAHASPPTGPFFAEIPVPYRPPVQASSLPLPVGAAPPQPQHQTQFNWSLNRNPSSSTAASSGMTPSTEESAMVETPSNAVLLSGRGGSSGGGLWEDLGTGAALSRASTFSYREGDDGTIVQIGTAKENELASDDIIDKRATVMPDQFAQQWQRHSDGSSSPTFSATLSTSTNTPTVSSGSDVTAKPPKSLRISTSNLELRTPRPLSQAVISNDSTETTPSSARRKEVTFEIQPLAAEVTETYPDVRPRPVRPAFGRLRSSSVGAMSVNTSSVYSVGEVMTATNATVATAHSVQLTTSTTMTATTVVSGPSKSFTGLAQREVVDVTETIRSFEASSKSVRRAFDYERARGEWPLAFVSDQVQDENRAPTTPTSPKTKSRRMHSARAAPLPPHLSPKSKNAGRPPLSPILRPSTSTSSPVKQVSFSSQASQPSQPSQNDGTPEEIDDPKSPSRPGMPARSGSLSRLWRRLSSSGSLHRGKKSKSMSYALPGDDEDIPPVPQAKKHETYKDGDAAQNSRIKRSRASLDLTVPLKSTPISSLLDSFAKENEPKSGSSDARPSTPSSVRSKKGKKRAPAVPPSRANSAPLSGWMDSSTPPELPPIGSLHNSLPSPDFIPFDFTASPLPVDGELPSLSEQQKDLTDAPVRSFRKLSAPPASSNWKTPLGPYTPPLSAIVSDYFRDAKSPANLNELPEGIVFAREIQLHRVSLHEDAEMQSYDAKRRYRQSLVEIKDDEAFQATVEELVKLESDGRVRMTRAGGAALRSGLGGGSSTPPPMFRTVSKDLLEKHARQENIRAWFVTRELVHGERRHGRLLARGVSAVKTAAKARNDLLPLPLVATSSEATLVVPKPVPAHYRSGSGNIKSPSRLRRPRTAGGGSERSGGRSSFGDPSPNSPVPPLPSQILDPPPSSSTPLDMLVMCLPKLQALSVALSERFEHDPSPYGVAEAFISMEEELTREISAWASQIGEIVTSGLGEELDKMLTEGRIDRRGRRASEGPGGMLYGDESDNEDRLGFADIIIMPIQRAARYRLLFQELSTKLPPTSHTSLKIHRALEASIRLASECDKCQSFDLNALRRKEKKGKKARPVSMGPGMPLNGVW